MGRTMALAHTVEVLDASLRGLPLESLVRAPDGATQLKRR